MEFLCPFCNTKSKFRKDKLLGYLCENCSDLSDEVAPALGTFLGDERRIVRNIYPLDNKKAVSLAVENDALYCFNLTKVKKVSV